MNKTNSISGYGSGVNFNDIGDLKANVNFDDAMGQIARQAQAREILEARAAKRQALYDKLTKVAVFLVFTGLLYAGYTYRNQLQDYVTAKLSANNKPQINASTTAALQSIQANAEKRDKVLDDITK